MYKTQLSAKVITLFPELFPGPLSASVTGRALENKLWSLETIDLKKYGKGRHKKVDDKPISGGPGMVLMPDVLDEAILKANNIINIELLKFQQFFGNGLGYTLQLFFSDKIQKKRKM